jgi:hypothetical protein
MFWISQGNWLFEKSYVLYRISQVMLFKGEFMSIKAIIVTSIFICLGIFYLNFLNNPPNAKYIGNGMFKGYNGTVFNCSEGYTTDLCCELWYAYEHGKL